MPEFVFAGSALAGEGDRRYMLLNNGVRLEQNTTEFRLAKQVTEPKLYFVRSVPANLGGGFLFGHEYAAYRAESFMGELKPLSWLPSGSGKIGFTDNAFVFGKVAIEASSGRIFASADAGKRQPSPRGKWIKSDTIEMLTHTAARGVTVDERTAAVVNKGYIHHVDLLTGAATMQHVLPSIKCGLWTMHQRVVGACWDQHKPYLVEDPLGQPKRQAPYVVGSEGVELGGIARFSGYVRVPKESGGTVKLDGFHNRHDGSKKTKLTAAAGQDESVVEKATRALVYRKLSGIRDDCLATRDGTVYAWVPEFAFGATDPGAHLKIAPDGQVTVTRFALLARRAQYAYGARLDGRWVQTTDFGRTWTDANAPPGGSEWQATYPYIYDLSCSAVGCFIGQWVRWGWRPRSETSTPVFELVPPPIPPRAPTITCIPKGAATVTAHVKPQRSPHADGGGAVWGYRTGAISEIYGPSGHRFRGEAISPYKTNSGTFIFARPFAVGGAVTRTVDFNRAKYHQPAKWMHLQPYLDHRFTLERPGTEQYGGLALRNLGALMLISASGQRNDRFFKDDPDLEVREVAVVGPGRLLVVAEELGSGELDLYETRAGQLKLKKKAAFTGAKKDDLIAINKRGELALVRIPASPLPVTSKRPALLIRPANQPLALAPWSALETSGSEACRKDKKGYRVTIRSEGWLRLREGQKLAFRTREWLRLKWSDQRLCLEAVEIGESKDWPHTIVRFDSTGAEAVKYSIDPQGQSQQPLTCSLSP